MKKSDRRVQQLARLQLDRRLAHIRDTGALLDPPRGGWVKALRKALGMPQAYVAEKMGVSRQAISSLEQREADGSVTLTALEQAAQALGGRVVYAIVLERSIMETLERRAVSRAKQMTGSVRHTMRLEDQEPLSDLDEATQELARELMASPGQLWS